MGSIDQKQSSLESEKSKEGLVFKNRIKAGKVYRSAGLCLGEEEEMVKCVLLEAHSSEGSRKQSLMEQTGGPIKVSASSTVLMFLCTALTVLMKVTRENAL